jgi:HlyD family secretion protein
MLEGAKDTLSKTTIRAPMDGVVTAKRIEEGEVAVIGIQNQPGTVLLTISDMSVSRPRWRSTRRRSRRSR